MSVKEDPVQIKPQIKPMSKSDIPQVMDIQTECRLSAWSKNSYLIALNDSDFMLYTAKAGSDPVGFIAARLITSENLCELLNIAVMPLYQDKKVGEALLFQLFRVISPKAGKISLEVREGNKGAIAFYNKYGFYPVGLRKNYYSDPAENALLMEKLLN